MCKAMCCGVYHTLLCQSLLQKIGLDFQFDSQEEFKIKASFQSLAVQIK